MIPEKVEIINFEINDSKLNASDAMVINYAVPNYLSTISHFRLLFSDDGITFYESNNYNSIFGEGEYKSYGASDELVCMASFSIKKNSNAI